MKPIKILILSLGFLMHSTPVFALRAGEVFIRFARERLGANFRKTMGDTWPRRIMRYTSEWSEWEAQEFLVILRGRIGDAHSVQRLKRASYFEFMRLEDFKERLELWDDFIGTEATDIRLSRSLGGFEQESPTDIRGNIKAVEGYVKHSGAVTIAKNNLHGFVRTRPFKLKRLLRYLERYFGPINDAGKKAVAEIAMTSFEALATTNILTLQGTLDYLDEYLGRGNKRSGRLKARPLVREHYSAVSQKKRTDVRSLTLTMDAWLGRDEAERTLLEYFSRAMNADPTRLRRSLQAVEEFFGGKPRMTGKALLELAHTDPDELAGRLESLRQASGLSQLRERFFEDFSLDAIKRLEEELQESNKPNAALTCVQLPLNFL